MSIFKSLLRKIVSFLEKDKFIILGICFFIIIYYSFTRYFLSTDHLFQFGTVINFLNGDGFSIKYFDGKFIYFLKQDGWPYFLRFLSMPFLYLTRNIELSSIVIRVLSYVVLFLTLRFFYKDLFGQQTKSNLALNVSLLFSAFSVVPFNYGNDIDLLSSAGLILSLILLQKYYTVNSKKIYLYLFFLIIALVCHMRYVYLPKIMIYLSIIFVYEVLTSKIKQNFFHKLFLINLLIMNFFFIITNDYFTSHSSSIMSFETTQKLYMFCCSKSFWHILYSPTFNTFFPDHILYTFIAKISNNSISDYYLSFVALMSFFSLLIFYRFIIILKKTNSFILNFLFVFCIINFFVILLIVRLKGFYSYEQIQNASLLAYSGLSVYNRYLVLFHISGFILALYFAIKKNLYFFKVLIISSLSFGVLHSCYLFTKYSYKRSENLKLISVNKHRYLDCIKTSEIVIKAIKNTNNILFIPVFELDSLEYRKRSPSPIVQANGGTVYKKFPEKKFLLKKRPSNLNQFDKIYYCDLSSNNYKYGKKFRHIYKGKFFSLFEKL